MSSTTTMPAFLLKLLSTSAVATAMAMTTIKPEPSRIPASKTGLSPTMPVQDRTMLGTLSVPNIGVGTIAWATQDSPDSAERLQRIAAASKAAGLDFFDTAERYGATGRSLIPAALKGLGLPIDGSYLGGDCESNLANWGAEATMATKFTPTPWRRTAQSVVTACTESARRLGVEQIPLYQVHMPDIIQPFARFGVSDCKDELYWDGMAECYHRGLIANVGVSNYGPTLVERAQEHLAKRNVPLASNQISFSLLYRRQGALATVERCNALGVKMLAYYPLAMGLLSGKLTPSKLRGKRDARSQDLLRYLEGGAGGTARLVPDGGIRPLLSVLHEVSARLGKTPAQVALNWVICKDVIPIVGLTSLIQVEENGGALGWRLSAEDVGLLDAAADALPFDFNGCGFQTCDSKFVGYGFERWKLD